MAFDPLTALFEAGKIAVEKIWPDPNKRAEQVRLLEEMRQKGDLERFDGHVKLLLAQCEINVEEAKSSSIFVAGWRPAVGWLCVVVFAFAYIVPYCMEWVAFFSNGSITALDIPQRIDATDLTPILLGMLGLGVMRSADKKNKVQTDRVEK